MAPPHPTWHTLQNLGVTFHSAPPSFALASCFPPAIGTPTSLWTLQCEALVLGVPGWMVITGRKSVVQGHASQGSTLGCVNGIHYPGPARATPLKTLSPRGPQLIYCLPCHRCLLWQQRTPCDAGFTQCACTINIQ